MLFKLSVSNIRRSLRDYAVYFFTLLIGVSVFYVFNAIGGQAAMLRVSESRNDIIELLKTTLSGVSVFVAGVLGLLIVYASRFLMKRRSKEFALYMTLGMSKGNISAILLLETLMIGIGSLFVGLLIGIGLSQLMSALVANLFEADMSAYKFSVSAEAIGKTILYFAVMYLVVMIFNSVVVTRMKLINLLQSGRRSEQIRLKNPILCVIVFLLAAAMLGYAYYNVGWNYPHLNNKTMALYICMGAAATFFIFWSVSGMILRVMMSAKNLYHRGLNVFTVRQISSKVNTTVFSMTVICLMLFVTICTLSSAFSIRNSMNANLKEFCPVDCEIEYRQYTEEMYGDTTYKDITELYAEQGHDLTADFSEYVHFHNYCDHEFTFGSFLGSQLDKFMESYRFIEYQTPMNLVRLSDYNKLAALYGKEQFEMADDEFILLCDFRSMKEVTDSILSEGYPINVCGTTLYSHYAECQEGFIDISSQRINTGIFIIPDSAADEEYAAADYIIGNYKERGSKEYESIIREVSLEVGEQDELCRLDISTKIDIADASVGLGALVTFLGLYIGLVFLIACGAILALKELSESADSAGRYEMLRRIGADENELSLSLFRQTGVFFLLPLLLAIVHSIFGMRFSAYILEAMGTEKMWVSVFGASLLILVIYGGYFLITYFCSRGIIKERR